MLDVARYRLILAESDPSASPAPLAERSIGPRLVAVTEFVEPSIGQGLAALMLAQCLPGSLISLDSIEQSLSFVRTAVREGNPAAPELLGMLRDAVSQRSYARGAGSIPPDVISKILTLSTIIARERRDPSAIAVAQSALAWGERWLVANDRPSDERDIVLSDVLRTTQELAELFDALGVYSEAWLALRRLRSLLRDFGDPEQEIEPDGWMQQLLLTSSSVNRHLARYSHRPGQWLQRASAHADRSADLVFSGSSLPISWGIGARVQSINAQLDIAEGARDGNPGRAQRALSLSSSMLEECVADLASWSRADGDTRALQSALFGLRLTGWRAALLTGEPQAAEAARSAALSSIGPWVLPRDRDKILRLERVSAASGLTGAGETHLPPATVADRAFLRPASLMVRHPLLQQRGTPPGRANGRAARTWV
jgi:hypothetical protein